MTTQFAEMKIAERCFVNGHWSLHVVRNKAQKVIDESTDKEEVRLAKDLLKDFEGLPDEYYCPQITI